MRNTLQEQYNLIKEGKGNKDSFMRTALRQFPNLVTPTLGFDMTVNILKQRQVISENIGGIVTRGVEQDWIKLFKENTLEEIKLGNPEEAAKKALADKEESLEEGNEDDKINKLRDIMAKAEKGDTQATQTLAMIMADIPGLKENKEIESSFTIKSIPDTFDERIKDKLEVGKKVKVVKQWKNATGSNKFLYGLDIFPEYGLTKDEINQLKNNLSEAKEVKAKVAKTDADVLAKETAGYDYKDKKNYDNVYGQEFLVGYYAEMKDPKNTEKTVDELKKIVAKNLESDSSYYVKKGQFGVKDLGYTDTHPGLGPTKEVKGKYKSSGMEPVKIKESIIKKIDFLIREGLDLKEIETVAEVAALEAKMSKVMKEKEKREKKIKALETLAEMDKEVVSKEGMNTLKKEVKLLEKMAADIEKKQDKLKGVKKEVLTSTDENLDNMSETEETEN